jgi:predicted nucleic acid-binding protein
MRPSVYVETSVLSALVDQRAVPVSQVQHQTTREWWAKQRRHFDLFYSEAVLIELTRADFPGRSEALACLDEMNLLPITEEIRGVARTYQEHLVMPGPEVGDAVHLAAACVHELDYLLTWNCQHLANTNKIRHIRVINMRLGLLTPELLTPAMLIAEEET